ncbi:hypothetical protein, partial [Heyndrickxia sporothermodurans]
MSNDKEKEFEETKMMSKEDAVNEIKDFFKGNKKFIEQATLMIYSTHHFEKLNRMQLIKDSWNWEKLLNIT